MRALILSWLLLAFVAAAQQPSAVEITSEPSHQLQLTNNWIRAFNVLAPARASTLVHRHNYDYVYVTLGDTDITNERVGEQPVPMSLKNGEVRFTKGGFAHAVVNNSDHPFHNITIELLHPSTGVHRCESSCELAVACASPDKNRCANWRKVIESDQWTVTTLTLPPGASSGEHTFGPHAAVAVSELNLKHKRPAEPEGEFHIPLGGLVWTDSIVYTLTNMGPQTAVIVSLEFKNP